VPTAPLFSKRKRMMSAVWRILFVVAVAVPGVAWAQSDDSDSDSGGTSQFTQTVTVRPDKDTQFDRFFSLKTDCSKDEDPTITISTGPKHGKFSARTGKTFLNFLPTANSFQQRKTCSLDSVLLWVEHLLFGRRPIIA
jgi:hypothetical protein